MESTPGWPSSETGLTLPSRLTGEQHCAKWPLLTPTPTPTPPSLPPMKSPLPLSPSTVEQ